MTIDINEPELEALILERMNNGQFRDVEDVSFRRSNRRAYPNTLPRASRKRILLSSFLNRLYPVRG